MGGTKPGKAAQPAGRRGRSRRAAYDESLSETDGEDAAAPPTRNKNMKNNVPGNSKKQPASSQQQSSSSQASQAAGDGNNAVDQKELVTTVLQHILMAQQKKLAIKKSELIKSMNGQSKDFKTVLTEVAETLDQVFGMQLVGIKQTEDNNNLSWKECRLEAAGHFMIASQFVRGILESSDSPMSEKDVAKDSAVRIILNSLYIVNQDVDEEHIWRILVSTNLSKVCGGQRDDLRKFLKTELVDPMYVARTEIKGQDEITFRYSWGVRSELECDKFEMLKHISHAFEKPMASFKKHYDALLKDKKYEERMATMNRDMNRNNRQRNLSVNSIHEVEEEDLQEIIVEEADTDDEVAEIGRRTTRNRRNAK